MASERFHQLTIRTPEGVTFSMTLASMVSRTLAWSIDAVVILSAIFILNKILTIVGIVSVDIAGAFMMIGSFVLAVGYGIFFEWRWRGQTIGKRLFKITVVDAGGLPLSFAQVAIRNLLRFIDRLLMFYFVGGVAALLSKRNQRLGDLAAGTVVIRQVQTVEPSIDTVGSDKYNSFRDYPHLENRLRQAVDPEERRLMVEALLRRQQMNSEARLALFDKMAASLAERVTFPAEATAQLASEQYVRNVVDSIYRK